MSEEADFQKRLVMANHTWWYNMSPLRNLMIQGYKSICVCSDMKVCLHMSRAEIVTMTTPPRARDVREWASASRTTLQMWRTCSHEEGVGQMLLWPLVNIALWLALEYYYYYYNYPLVRTEVLGRACFVHIVFAQMFLVLAFQWSALGTYF